MNRVYCESKFWGNRIQRLYFTMLLPKKDVFPKIEAIKSSNPVKHSSERCLLLLIVADHLVVVLSEPCVGASQRLVASQNGTESLCTKVVPLFRKLKEKTLWQYRVVQFRICERKKSKKYPFARQFRFWFRPILWDSRAVPELRLRRHDQTTGKFDSEKTIGNLYTLSEKWSEKSYFHNHGVRAVSRPKTMNFFTASKNSMRLRFGLHLRAMVSSDRPSTLNATYIESTNESEWNWGKVLSKKSVKYRCLRGL